MGTCYVAEDEVITLLETWGGLEVVPSYAVDERDASTVCVRSSITVADLTSNQALSFGITAEVFTTTDYSLTQQWAASLNAAGYHGVRYWARHDLQHTHACLAIFDSAGDNGLPASGSPYQVLATTHLPKRKDLTQRLFDETGIEILNLP